MELEFDKEINAILRKAGQNAAAGPASAASAHIDADMIAAFAENALPDRARPPMIPHFAACDRCRELLASSILLNSEAGATAASSVLSEAAAGITIPWYQKLFRTPGLALAMGAVVLVFTGVLGYLVLQNRNSTTNTAVSEVREPEDKRGGPYDSGSSDEGTASNSTVSTQTFNSNASSSNAAMSSNTAARELQPISEPNAMANSAPPAGRVDSGEPPIVAGADDRSRAADGLSTGAASGAGMPVAAAPPPPASTTLDVTKTEADEKKHDNDKRNEQPKDQELAKMKEAEEQRAYRDAPAAAAKAGPARSGPMQMKSNQANNRVYDMSVTRKVGGRSFNNRDGAWYDTAYHGQSTVNVGRGSEEFKKLDSGLRSIANSLGGVVVVVWKGKAYRIQ